MTESNNSRREFIQTGLKIAAVTGIASISFLSGCEEDNDEKKVSPPEDLMQEHGLLNRILLIYDHCKIQLANKNKFYPEVLLKSAGIIRSFVEDYHEKQEEDYLFPRFEKANQHVDLVGVLRQQHKIGRITTDKIIHLCKIKSMTETESQQLIELLTDFNYMYRPHEAREDTVLFPAFRKIVSKNEYDSLGEEFEKNEQNKFGEDGFETMVEKVAVIEKQLEIYDLTKFTPKV